MGIPIQSLGRGLAELTTLVTNDRTAALNHPVLPPNLAIYTYYCVPWTCQKPAFKRAQNTRVCQASVGLGPWTDRRGRFL